MTGARGAAAGAFAARWGYGVLLVLCSVVSLGWLAMGAVVAAVRYWPGVARSVDAAGGGSPLARAVVDAAPASGPLSQVVLDYGFSTLDLVLAGVLLTVGARTWPLRLLAVALVGSAGALNLQADAAARGVEHVTGLAISGVPQVVLHGIACTAYVLALLMFPTRSWDGLPGGRSVREGLIVVGVVTFVLVGVGTAVLPHATSCVLFLGFLVPAVGLVVLPRRVRRGPGAQARAQARLLFSTLVGGFAVAAVLGIITLVMHMMGDAPRLVLVGPMGRAGGAAAAAPSGDPIALLFWFSWLASAAIAVVVLLATRHDGLWTAERWFSRALAVLLVMAVGGGGFIVLCKIAAGVLPTGAVTVAIVAGAVLLGPLYVRTERLVDRLLYGRRPAPYRVLADITALSHSTTVSSSGSAPDLARVAEAVALGLRAGVCRLTVLRPGLRDRVYEWTDPAGGFGADDLLEVPVRHGNEQVGALAVDRQAVSGLNAQRNQLLTDIADGLGVVLEASRSAIELERQLRAALAHAEEIATSRRRTVAEMDSERRRIERDLHDGAQHHLVSLRLTLGLVEHEVATGELGQARERLHKLTEQLTVAEAVLAATAEGVSFLMPSERGLMAALRTELGAAHPPAGFETDGIPAGRRFPAEVEAAVWFCCTESVGNARKHAQGAPVIVRLTERAGALTFTVHDEGPGFAVEAGTDPEGGRGLRNMAARVAAVGGHVAIRSAPGAGTTVEGSVPLPRPAESTGESGLEATPESIPEPVSAPAPVPTPEAEAAAFSAVGSGQGSLAVQVRTLVRAACAAYRGTPMQARVDDLARRLDQPVRIAVLGTVEEVRRMVVEALVGTPAVPRPVSSAQVPVQYTYGDDRVESGSAAVVVTLPAPALRAMTLIDAPAPGARGPDPPDADAPDHLEALLGGPSGEPPMADAFVLVLQYGRRADLRLLDLMHAAGQRGAIGVLARADDAGNVAGAAAREYGNDPAVRRICRVVVPVAPATAVAAARLDVGEYRLVRRWAAAGDPESTGGVPVEAQPDATAPIPILPDGRTPGDQETAAAVLDRLGQQGAGRALALLRGGEGNTRVELAAALVRHSGLAQLQGLIASRFLRCAEALRSRSVLAGLDAVLRASPPPGGTAHPLRYGLERVRAGAHELREIELLDVLWSGELPLPADELRAAERLLGASGCDVRARLGLVADATVEQLRAAAARESTSWRELAAHPVASTRVRDAAQVLIRTCEQLVAEVDDPAAPPGSAESEQEGAQT